MDAYTLPRFCNEVNLLHSRMRSCGGLHSKLPANHNAKSGEQETGSNFRQEKLQHLACKLCISAQERFFAPTLIHRCQHPK
jgi:hypothetical protein